MSEKNRAVPGANGHGAKRRKMIEGVTSMAQRGGRGKAPCCCEMMRAVAIHEAGHAVAIWRAHRDLGLEPRLRLSDGRGFEAFGVVIETHAHQLPDEWCVRIYLAGPIAEARWGAQPTTGALRSMPFTDNAARVGGTFSTRTTTTPTTADHKDDVEYSDVSVAYELIGFGGRDLDRLVEEMVREVAEPRTWAVILALAATLVERRRLFDDDIGRIIHIIERAYVGG